MLPTTQTTKLTGKALRHLRALGHALDPVIAVGKQGVTPGLVKETQNALGTHELIKVRVMLEAPVDRRAAAEELADQTGAVLAQVVGRTFLLYKRHPKKPKIVLPKAKAGESGEAGEKAKPAEAPQRRARARDEGDEGE
jgi:RNA-binding protein